MNAFMNKLISNPKIKKKCYEKKYKNRSKTKRQNFVKQEVDIRI